MFNYKLFSSLSLVAVVLMVLMLVLKLTQPSKEDLIKDGKYWSTDCNLKEIDVPGGVFTSNINRLDCSGVIVNVVTDKYNRALSAYNKSKRIEIKTSEPLNDAVETLKGGREWDPTVWRVIICRGLMVCVFCLSY